MVTVVPHEGTWIEIMAVSYTLTRETVVPHEGTWIEIGILRVIWCITRVVPHEGTWIEIGMYGEEGYVLERRSPRGNVD